VRSVKSSKFVYAVHLFIETIQVNVSGLYLDTKKTISYSREILKFEN